ncbi:MAG: thioredoxin family protein [Opitutales bacterium]
MMQKIISMSFFWISLLGTLGIFQTMQAAKHKELGDVRWTRDYETALDLSKESGKPVLILFQEVPGCSGCQKYGQQTLSEPRIVKAIEENFVPLAIFNNRGGKDREILKQYNERAWNYQVMRFIDADEKEIIPRKGNVWNVSDTAQRMIEALKEHGNSVPEELLGIVKER